MLNLISVVTLSYYEDLNSSGRSKNPLLISPSITCLWIFYSFSGRSAPESNLGLTWTKAFQLLLKICQLRLEFLFLLICLLKAISESSVLLLECKVPLLAIKVLRLHIVEFPLQFLILSLHSILALELSAERDYLPL